MTKKQKRFIEEYLIDLNATQAAIRAGYSPDTAKSIGSENLTVRGKVILQPQGKEFFTSRGNDFFT